MHIGFYGLGIMGSRMAANLLDSDNEIELTVYNRTISKADPLAEKGAAVAGSANELAANSDLLFTMLSTPEAVEEAADGEEGFLPHMRPDTLWVDCSTVNPSFSRRMAREAGRHAVRFVDAPVAGSKAPAASGDLLFLAGGSEEDVTECSPCFDRMGRNVIHAGGTGMGTSLKMVFNLLLGEAMLAFSEGLALGESLGLSKQMLLETLAGSPVAAPFISGKKEKIASGEYEPEFPLKWMQKDLQLASQSGYETGTPLPGVNAVKEVFAQAKQAGLGEKDFSAICAFLAGEDIEGD